MKHGSAKFAVLILAVALLFCACGSVVPSVSPDKPQRVAVLLSSFAQMWQEAGGTVDITVGEAIERGLVPENTPIVDSGAGKTVNVELLISLKPDLVICSADIAAQVEVEALLRETGTPTLLLHVETLTDYIAAMKQMTDITGDRAAYENAAAMGERVRALTKTTAPRFADTDILFVRAGSTASSTKAKSSQDHFAADMLRELGCTNLADETPLALDTLGMEAILAADPDFIFFSLMGDGTAAEANVKALLLTDTWQALSAVQNGRYTILDRSLFHFKPCQNWEKAYHALVEILSAP